MGACCPSHVISNIQIRHANKRLLWQTACLTVVTQRTLGCLLVKLSRCLIQTDRPADFHACPPRAPLSVLPSELPTSARPLHMPTPSWLLHIPPCLVPPTCPILRNLESVLPSERPTLSQAAAHADPQLAAAHAALPGPSDMPYTPQPRKGFACTHNTYRWLLSLLIANSKQCQATVAVLDTAAMLSRPYHECTCSRLPDARRDHGVRRISTHKQGDMSSPLLECRPPFP